MNMITFSLIYRFLCGVLVLHLLACEDRVTTHHSEKINTEKQTVDMKLLDGIHSSNAETRMTSVISLGEVGDLGDQSDIVIKELIILLSDVAIPVSDEECPHSVGVEAAQTLVKIGSKSIRPLLDALQSENHIVRWLSAIALGEIRDPSVVAGLNRALIHDPNPNVRLNAAEALGKIGDHRALSSLQEALKDNDDTVVLVTIRAIGNIGDPIMIKHLTPFVNSSDKDIAEFARMAIEKLNDKVNNK